MNNNKKQNNGVNIFNFPAKKYSSYIFDTTTKYQKKYGFDMGTGEHATWNNEADAFKHAFMQAQLSLWFGKHAAKISGDFHEYQGNRTMGQTKGEENMDRWNNQQGREIAKEIIYEYGAIPGKSINEINNIIADKVMKRMKEGKLITSPKDKRKYDKTREVPSGFNTQRGSVNLGHPTGHAAPIENRLFQSQNPTSDSPTPFTPEQIGQMSQEEFNRNEGAIMEQLRKGQIGQQSTQTDYSTYKNPQSGKGRVFTREDLDKMSTSEYTKHETEIMAQMNSIGIPSKTEVSKSTTAYSQEKVSRQNTGSSEGRWVTINGNHVFIEK